MKKLPQSKYGRPLWHYIWEQVHRSVRETNGENNAYILLRSVAKVVSRLGNVVLD